MNHIIDYILENSQLVTKNNPHKLFQNYFDNFNFDNIPHLERDKDVENYEDVAKLSRIATEANIDDNIVIESNDESIESVSQVIDELKKEI